MTYPNKDLDESGQNSGLADSLNLFGISGGDVGDGPGGFLDNVHPGVLEKGSEDGERAGGQHGVGLDVASGHNVTQGSECGGHHLELPASKATHEAGDDAHIHHFLDLLIGAVS